MTSIFTSLTNGMPWLIRTDFSDEDAWAATCEAAAADRQGPERPSAADGFQLVNDTEFDALTPDALLDLDP